MRKKIAFITGICGQDGSYLAKYLLDKNYYVIGAERANSSNDYWRLKYLNIYDKINFINFDLLESSLINQTISKFKPDELYNLASQSFVGSSFELPIYTSDVTALGPLRILEAIRYFSPHTRFYQASSSEMFGKVKKFKSIDENTPFAPQSPYAFAKLFAHNATVNYRESYNLFACSGILFNHESPLRGSNFVTKKVVKALVEIKYGKRQFFEIGNLYSLRDWGYAADYVEGMHKILNHKKPDDYILSTNKCYSVKDFINIAARNLALEIKWQGKNLSEVGISKDGKKIIRINKKFFRPTEVDFLKGSYKKAKKILGWKPKTNFENLVKKMINFEISLLN